MTNSYVPEPPEVDLRGAAAAARGGTDTATDVEAADMASLGELIGDLTHDVGELMTTQLELAVVEMKEEVRQAARAGSMLGAGALVGYLALLLAGFTLAFGLAEWMDLWVAFLIVTALFAAGAAALFVKGRTELKATDPVPRQTKETL